MRGIVTLAALAALAGCGGGGGGGPFGDGVGGGDSGVSYTPGLYPASSGLANQCAAPRTGNDPNGRPWPDRAGSIAAENNFLRSWTNELYLWYREVPDLNPSNSNDPLAFFDLLKTSALTPSGRLKDQFHFTYDTDDYLALSQSGIEPGYGAQWAILSDLVPRKVVAAFIEPGSAAGTAGLTRGAEVREVDGVSIDATSSQQIQRLNLGLFPLGAGENHQFVIRELNGSLRTITMATAQVAYTPVRDVTTIPTASGPVGYMVFNDHNAPSEQMLINAVNQLRAANVVDLILDLRYNGGGYLDIASEMAYMIGGAMTAGQTFERLVFNDKHTVTNPVTGQQLVPTPFHTRKVITTPIQDLPTLNLPQPRVYVIASGNTCSASEAIINGLRGVDVDVFVIGGATCGKPYGFYPEDNCGTTYFSIQFQGVNADNFGDYADGFKPANSSALGIPLPGCAVADDFTHQLGDPAEARLAAALSFRDSNNQTCPAPTGFAPGDTLSKASAPLSATDGMLVRSPVRENRIMTRQ